MIGAYNVIVYMFIYVAVLSSVEWLSEVFSALKLHIYMCVRRMVYGNF